MQKSLDPVSLAYRQKFCKNLIIQKKFRVADVMKGTPGISTPGFSFRWFGGGELI